MNVCEDYEEILIQEVGHAHVIKFNEEVQTMHLLGIHSSYM